MPEGLETFADTTGALCIVLARTGTTALIARPKSNCTPFVVPCEHVRGASDWWQGRYFSYLADAWAFYQKEVEEAARL